MKGRPFSLLFIIAIIDQVYKILLALVRLKNRSRISDERPDVVANGYAWYTYKPKRAIGALQLAASLSIYVQPQLAEQIKDQAVGRGRTGQLKILGSYSDTKLAAAG